LHSSSLIDVLPKELGDKHVSPVCRIALHRHSLERPATNHRQSLEQDVGYFDFVAFYQFELCCVFVVVDELAA
jgi:hypothetical protein